MLLRFAKRPCKLEQVVLAEAACLELNPACLLLFTTFQFVAGRIKLGQPVCSAEEQRIDQKFREHSRISQGSEVNGCGLGLGRAGVCSTMAKLLRDPTLRPDKLATAASHDLPVARRALSNFRESFPHGIEGNAAICLPTVLRAFVNGHTRMTPMYARV